MIIEFPSDLKIAKQTWGQRRNDLSYASMFGAQSVELAPPVWEMSIEPPVRDKSETGAFESLILRLRGRGNKLACHNMRRPQPAGTLRGSMTAYASKGAGSLTINAPGQGTLLAGDFLGVGSGDARQVVMVTADATASGGKITVAVEPPLRNAVSGAVVWDKPKAIFRRAESSTSWDYTENLVSVAAVSFVEDWR